jgi:hypothetical protein
MQQSFEFYADLMSISDSNNSISKIDPTHLLENNELNYELKCFLADFDCIEQIDHIVVHK